MAPLTAGRATAQRHGDFKEEPVAAAQIMHEGGIVMRQADGFLVTGATAVGLVGVGVGYDHVDNNTGAAGDKLQRYRSGTFQFFNSAGADEITRANIGDLVYAVDDQTVALTDGGATRSPVGFVEDVELGGVWIRFDEALVNAHQA